MCIRDRALDIHHVTGSTYHPETRGTVERMHGTMAKTVRGLVAQHPDKWEEMLPHAQCILRSTPRRSLGGRSPYQIVTGLRPRMPRMLTQGLPARHLSVDDYVKNLLAYLRVTYDAVERIQAESIEGREMSVEGSAERELQVGDSVKVRLPPDQKREGPLKFMPRCRPGLFVITKRFGPNAFQIANCRNLTRPEQHVYSADNLVKMEPPELDLEPGQNRVLEIYDNKRGEWTRHRIDRFASDGAILLSPMIPRMVAGTAVWDDFGVPFWTELDDCHYR